MTMQKMGGTASRLKPRITLSAEDYERLSALARAAKSRMRDLAEGLEEELERAQVLAKGRHSGNIICMGSEVEYRDDATGKIQRVMLVYPDAADISQGKISVLTPVGTALIGLPVGRSITWETRSGEIRQLTVLAVREPGRTTG
jgi:regulator of nucleoside diphosphate kinase